MSHSYQDTTNTLGHYSGHFMSEFSLVVMAMCFCHRFSESGYFLTYDTKGVVRLLDSAHYGGSSWIPILDTSKQVGNKSDHYFLVGMTHETNEIWLVLTPSSLTNSDILHPPFYVTPPACPHSMSPYGPVPIPVLFSVKVFSFLQSTRSR